MNMLFIILLAIQLFFTVLAIYRYVTSQKKGLDWYKKEMESFSKQHKATLDTFLDEYRKRQNLLSKENARLIEENDKYRSKLKNLGFSDITLDN